MPLPLDSLIRLVVLAGLTYSCVVILQPFLPVLLWVSILAVILNPLYLWLHGRMGLKPALAGIAITGGGLLILIGPVAAVLTALLLNLAELAELFSHSSPTSPPLPAGLLQTPVLGSLLASLWHTMMSNLGLLIRNNSAQLTALSGELLQFTLAKGLGFLQLLASIVLAPILMIRAKPLMHRLERVLQRLAPEHKDAVIIITTITVRNVSRGVVGVAFGQALLIGLGLVIAQVPWAGLLTLLALVLALIQVGPAPAVLAALVLAWSQLPLWHAALLTLWLIPVNLLDNLLKPLLMARGLPVPMVVILLGVLGGTLKGGITGLFVGPVVLSLGYHFLRLWAGVQPSTPLAAAESSNP